MWHPFELAGGPHPAEHNLVTRGCARALRKSVRG